MVESGLFTTQTLAAIADVLKPPLNERALQIMVGLEKAGVHETSPNRSPMIDHIKEYVNGYTDSEPWCADAVTYCYKKASNELWPKAGCFNHRYCPSWLESARRNRCGLAVLTRGIRKGDPVLFDWDGDGVPDHIGMVKRAYPGFVRTIEGPIPTEEGNTGLPGKNDGVYSKWRKKSSIVAFVRVTG
jgi:hypothetical protein